jgi:2-(3-amino-3-carboxypropyl)histidine synthase
MFDIERVKKELENYKAKRVFLQIPEGLKNRAQDFANQLESQGLEVFLSMDPCYGACDIQEDQALRLGCEAIIHIGHSDFGVKSKLPVIYEPYEIKFDSIPLLKKHLKELKRHKRMGLITTAQFLKTIEISRNFLESEGIKILLGTQTRSGKAGHVLGCDYSAAIPMENKVDCFLYLGSGLFHPLGLALKTEKPVLFLDFETGELKDLKKEKERLERIRAYHLEHAKDAENFGILLTTKPGQILLKQAERVKTLLEKKGKKAWILIMDQVTPEKLLGLNFEVLVNCACPRMNEDSKLFKKPILNPEDIESLCNEI